ncbi:ubiquitin carboxyl-terminal hydrolase [Anaeramoeba ignava]|uniref:ubiquitinyl hydrolase 1 n=1 Tax=Anaeramoeba ignava TaxID=1746090 RepID=A0A9Q0RBK1_ANAIG|nr:ubiquitin carboxyl-terminal hydrolase [Anaeramoeba ignava]
MIHFKRFSFGESESDQQIPKKISTKIDFPPILDLSDRVINKNVDSLVYELFAISNHHGQYGSGHYTAYAKNKILEKWHFFDDKQVYEIDQQEIQSVDDAYLLFYQKVQKKKN